MPCKMIVQGMSSTKDSEYDQYDFITLVSSFQDLVFLNKIQSITIELPP